MKKLLVSICVAALLMTGCGGEKTAEQPKPPPPVEQKENSYSNGQFKVGADLPAGEYLAIGTGYVEVAKDSSGNMNAILINDNVENAQRYVTAHEGEYVKLTGDIKLYPEADAPKLNTKDGLPSGEFKAGVDMPAGEYKIALEAGGYFAVTRDARRSYVKNQYTPDGGSFYTTVADGQYLQIKKGTGQFVGADEAKIKEAIQETTQAPPPAPLKF